MRLRRAIAQRKRNLSYGNVKAAGFCAIPLEKRSGFKDFPTKPCRNLAYMRDLALPPISPLELAAAGEALYGRDWRIALCDVLNVTTTELAMVECGQLPAPTTWRGVLVNVA